MGAQADWADLIPHAGAMRLIDVVLTWNVSTIHATGERHVLSDHPLRDDVVLHAVWPNTARKPPPCMARCWQLREAKPGCGLDGWSACAMCSWLSNMLIFRGSFGRPAECLFADERGAQYAFKVEQCARLLASGRTAVMHTEA